jgi:hypothetical protein
MTAMIGNARRALVLTLVVLVLASPACGVFTAQQQSAAASSQPASTAAAPAPAEVTEATTPGAQSSPVSAATLDTLLICSYPPGLKAYVMPKSDLPGGPEDTAILTAQEHFVGTTPSEVKLEPGNYMVTIADLDHPMDFREDGEDNQLVVEASDGQGGQTSKLAGKEYNITKRAGRQALVTALFWPQNQSLEDFVRALPDVVEFPVYKETFEADFQKYSVPAADWPLLLSVIQRTGKAVWHGADRSQYLYLYFNEVAPKYLFSMEYPGTQAVAASTPVEPTPTETAVPSTPTPTAVPALFPVIGTPNPPGVPARYKPGDLISLGDLTLSVLGWSRGAKDNRGFSAEAGKEYVVVDLALLNRSSQPVAVPNFWRYQLRDADGQQYSGGPSMDFLSLQPGQPWRVPANFQVSQASHGFVLAFDMTDQSQDYLTVDLGLQPASLPWPAALQLPEPYLLEAGQVITRDGVSLAVPGWQSSVGSQRAGAAPGMQLVAMDVVLTNLGSQSLEFSPADCLKLRDADRREYWHDSRFEYITGDLSTLAPWFVQASPGERVRFTMVYQVPQDSHGFALIYRPPDSEQARAYLKLSDTPGLAQLPAGQSGQPAGEQPIGQVIHHGDTTLDVLGWEWSAGHKIGNREVLPAPGKQFVLVDVMVVNHASASITYWSWHATLRDASLHQYPAEVDYFDPFSEHPLPLDAEIGPGDRARGKMAFQVPEGSSGLVFALDVAPNGGDEIFVALGPQPVAGEPPAELLAPNPNAHKVGETVKQGDAAVTLLAWALTAGSEKARPKPGHLFLVVDMTLVNQGSHAMTSSTGGGEPKVRDTSGQRFWTSQDYKYGDQPAGFLFTRGLQPGQPVRGQFVYEAPAGSQSYAFLFDPKWLFGYKAGDTMVFELGSQPAGQLP